MGRRQFLVAQDFTELSQGTAAGDWPHCGSSATGRTRQLPDFAQIFISSPCRSWGLMALLFRMQCEGGRWALFLVIWPWPLQLKRGQQKFCLWPWVPWWTSLIPSFLWQRPTSLPGHRLGTMVFSTLARLNLGKDHELLSVKSLYS